MPVGGKEKGPRQRIEANQANQVPDQLKAVQPEDLRSAKATVDVYQGPVMYSIKCGHFEVRAEAGKAFLRVRIESPDGSERLPNQLIQLTDHLLRFTFRNKKFQVSWLVDDEDGHKSFIVHLGMDKKGVIIPLELETAKLFLPVIEGLVRHPSQARDDITIIEEANK